MAGIYVHIPFCASRCIYCGFYSSTGLLGEQDRYVNALLKEMRMRADYLGGEPIDTAYIGGGTPSLLSAANLTRLCGTLSKAGNLKEFTVECNPDDVTDSLCRVLASNGVNRVSLGVQTFSDARLRFLRRRHTASNIPQAVEKLRHAGIHNISIDLMFGFPGETTEEWRKDINAAIAIGVPHISAYSLMYEEGTPLYLMRERGDIAENTEENSAEMYDTLIDTLTAAGYEHYEISNFARPDHHSKHNSCYWNGTKYLGLGAAAHSYNRDNRQWNVSDLREYIRAIEADTLPMEQETINTRTRYNDLVTTALRTREGISLRTLTDEERAYIISSARKSIANGTLEQAGDNLKLTRKGLYISDDVMSELIRI